jgi:hypothetical protein
MSHRGGRGIVRVRTLWVGLALVVLVLFGLTFPLAAGSREQAATDARERAIRTADDLLLGAISPELASTDIVGTSRRDLAELVRERILDDDRVARVLIWIPDGDLIFSSARADTPETIASDDLRFSQAAGGVPASVVVEDGGAALHRTLVPLRSLGSTDTYAVAQIDQRYDAITAEATRAWRVTQVALLVVLGILVLLLALSFRGGRGAARSRERSSERDEQAMRELEGRADAAERAAQKAEERLAVAERRLNEASMLELPPSIVARVEELETQLERETAERERSEVEARGIRETLEAKEGEFTRSAELVAEANARAEDAGRRAGEAEGRAAEAEQRAADLAARIVESEARISELETSLANVRAAPSEPESGEPVSEPPMLEVALLRDERDVARADLVRALNELEATRGELDEARTRIAEMEAQRRHELS